MSAVIRIRPSRRATDLPMVHRFLLADLMLENRALRSEVNRENGVPQCLVCRRHHEVELVDVIEDIVLAELGL